ncbi:MAG TPA: formate dehydrogenase accessory protein FdhE [Pyrinomonadaceae bacterium]|nr:formate dehydrogenase accessory protein FdhE [Pyrinomonadaceae bacterium]
MGGERTFPCCGSKPQVSFLQNKESSPQSDDLLCATCLSTWEFRRVVCANCGEERPTKLGYFHSPEFEHVRIEACDSCLHCIKGVDLTRLGHAEALVDDMLRTPTLIVEGEQSTPTLEGVRAWAEAMPNARLLLISNSGHFPQVERPDLFFPSVERFLRGAWPTGAVAGRTGAVR